MKRTAPWIAAAVLLVASSAMAQPGGKAKKGKGKKPATTAPSDIVPVNPYGLGDPTPTPKPGSTSPPVNPYGLGAPTTTAKPGAPAPKPGSGGAPVDPYAGAPTPTPTPKPGSGGAPVDPYAPTPTPTPKPGSGGAPVDPYAPTPTPTPGSGGAPVNPYAGAPTAPPKPGPAPFDPYAPAPAPAPAPPAPAVGPADPYGLAAPAAGDPAAPAGASARLDVAAVQGLLAVQGFDGWLLADVAGQNTVARTLVAPAGAPSRRWFYLIPRTGEPTLLCHVAEAASFTALPGRHVVYAGYRDLDKAVKSLLKGKKTVAMEYSPKGALPSLSRVDAGTLELVRAAAVTVKSSEVLVQFVKATWGPHGRRSHYIAAHHLGELRKDALGFVRERLASGIPVTELEVQQRIAKGMALRGLIGPPPVVAFGKHSADPDYLPTPERAATLRRGDVVLLSLAGKLDGGMFAALSWVAVAERTAPLALSATFDAVVRARDEAMALIRDRFKRRRAVQGWEVDRAARDLFVKGGLDRHALHRTGHSLDSDLQGSGTDLDDLEVKDKRAVVVGTGFTIGPGLYYEGELGVRAEISAFLGKDGLEITTPVQERVETLLGP